MIRRKRNGQEVKAWRSRAVALMLLLPLSSSFLSTSCCGPLTRRKTLLPPPAASSKTTTQAAIKTKKKMITKIDRQLRSKRKRNGSRDTQYKRKRIPETEKELKSLRRERQAEYERIMSSAEGGSPSIWSFESLFPEPVWDEESVERDINAVKESRSGRPLSPLEATKSRRVTKSLPKRKPTRFYGGSLQIRNEPLLRPDNVQGSKAEEQRQAKRKSQNVSQSAPSDAPSPAPSTQVTTKNTTLERVDPFLTRMVEDRIYGYRRTPKGDFQYETSLLGDGAVKFRDGVRLGNPLKVNADRLNYFAKKELQQRRVEEAQELYERAAQIDPRDGRAYLGLSRCAQRRRDFKLAKKCLQTGIANSVSLSDDNVTPDRGANPFLLQALGCIEEEMGGLSEAEALYISAVKSRPYHAAAWVSLAQLRTRKLGQSASAGRMCFQTAELQLKKAGMRPSTYVYTAWAAMEYEKAGDTRRARELFKAALDADPKCSAAWLQLGVMEADCENWEEAQSCFEAVLKFDQRNSRVMQAYALMEAKRPDGDSRKAIDLFERALRAKPRDAGVLQAYALYVAELGDIDSARDLLRRGTEVNKRHAAVWQAWGVLETRHGTAEDARSVFQQGIWACAQLTGSQSGGYRCARLWQAWGVLEAREKDYAAARRCFSRALDADSRNIAAFTAWALMEEELGNVNDARSVFESALHRFSACSDEKLAVWRSYELMEQRLGNLAAAQQVYQRSMREAITRSDEPETNDNNIKMRTSEEESETNAILKRSKEVEVSRWVSEGGEVWLNDRAIEARVPFDMKRRKADR